ncbi:MAG TPA: SRPBCC family protein [Fibrobacteria bacterium]|jgi:uncharacterized protein YndB with AHSA1/START domain|nr:SRPBCC family protein [Fibrobacteria bacterium]
MKITITTQVAATPERVWEAYTNPEDVKRWNFASPEWHCPAATADLRVGGAFSWRMEAKDGSFGFDFAGTYTKLEPHSRIEYAFGDRTAQVSFEEGPAGVTVSVTFDAEEENSADMQRAGWQAILDNFRTHVEAARAA